jgi:NAD(P)-dependent dehydrogenase (short-subunit alcohol dehydrogenase family)
MTESGKRVCLMTGAGGILGSEFCRRYRHEYDIVAVYRSQRPWFPSQDARVVDPLDPSGRPAENDDPIYTVRANLLNAGAPVRVVEAALHRFGRIDLVVNAAMSTTWAPMIGSPKLADSVATQFGLAVEVPLRIAAAVAELSWQSQAASNRELNRNIVNVSSVAATRIYRGSGQSVYAAAKAALHHLTGHMAAEFDPLGVRVNATEANSYPQLVPLARAVEAIHTLDHGSETGTVVVVDGAEDEQHRIGEPIPVA